MGIFIGSDTQSLNYDFGLKVANSVAECPMKIYKGAIDVNNPPSPFTYPQQVSDFIGKVSGSTTENPNIFKSDSTTSTLIAPSNVAFEETGDYSQLVSLDGTCKSHSASVNGNIAKQLFSFDLIKIFERQYGTIPSTTDTASKVAWLKNNVNSLVVNYYGWGSCPSGNKIYLDYWDAVNSCWAYKTAGTQENMKNTSSTPSLLTINIPSSFINNKIDTNGMLNLLAYSESSNGTIPSVVNTDYISLTINYKDQSSVVWWQEVQDQKTLDKLKQQNEIPITSVDYANRTAVWNGKNLVNQTDTNVAVRDDFAGKISGDTTGNPNIAKGTGDNTNYSTLLVPSSMPYEFGAGYSKLNLQDNLVIPQTTNVVNSIPQQLFSFNIIRLLEDKFGSLPCPNDLASKIAYAKANISVLKPQWYGYGVSPLGNKAYFDWWRSYSWGGSPNVNTSNTPSLSYKNINNDNNNLSNAIDSNGFVHLLAYTDSARTTDSTLLVLTNHGLSVNDIIENTTRGLSSQITNVLTNNFTCVSSIASQSVGDNINKYHYTVSKTAETGTNSTTIKITDHGLSTGDYIGNNTTGNIRKVTVVDANTLTISTAITNQTSGNSISLYHLSGTQTAESTVIPSTIYTDYISLDIQLKSPQGYDLLVPSNPRRDSVTGGNYDNIVMAEKVYNQVVSDYTGKVSGDLNSNPNIAKYSGTTSLQVPSAFTTEFITTDAWRSYDNIKVLSDSKVSGMQVSGNGAIPQQLFQFDLVKIFEKQYGTINATDKVSWLKSNISSIKCDWYGYGSCPSGYMAYIAKWSVKNNIWKASTGYSAFYNNTNTIKNCYMSDSDFGLGVSDWIDSNGIVNFLAYTDASDGTPSTIFTDYVKLTITFNNGNNGIEYFTNNSVEIATQTSNKATAYMCEVDLSPVCSALFGNSNSALKSAWKSINVDCYASGYGANGNDIINGVVVTGYSFAIGGGYAWSKNWAKGTEWNNNITSNITDMNYYVTSTTGGYTANDVIASNNKIYILVCSLYNSSTDVPSSVSLDYISVRVDLQRTPDVISPIQITL